jgi:hypothetical protein
LLPIRSGFWDQLEKKAKARAANARTSGLAKNAEIPLACVGGVAMSLSLASGMIEQPTYSWWRTINASSPT